MTIIFLINIDKIELGGGDYSVYKYGEYLARRGNSIYMFWVTNPNFYMRQSKDSNLYIEKRFKISRIFRGSTRIDSFIEKIYDLYKLDSFIEKNKEKIDYIVGYQTKTAIKAQKYRRKYNIKTVNFIFETPEWLKRQWGNEWLEKWKNDQIRQTWNKFKKALDQTDVIFPISIIAKNQVESWLGRSIADPIYPGIDINDIENINPYIQKKSQIIYIGRLRQHKNVNEIIRALSMIKSKPKLIICGDGPDKYDLMTLARKLNVFCDFRGIITDYEKWTLISESKFMVFPSSFEGFGMPPLEALACGIPCICTDIPILREGYQDKVEYFVEHNIEQLVGKIEYLLHNPDYCKKRGYEGRNYVLNRFSWEKSAEKIMKILINRKSNNIY